MLLLALSPETSDLLTVWGFVATIAGTLVGVLGFGYTIYQVWKVKAAAEAAEAAAKNVLFESKRAFTRFVGTNASRLLSELQRAVNEHDWKLAAIRAHDLAEILGTLPGGRERVVRFLADLRTYGQQFAGWVGDAKPRLGQKKWSDLLVALHSTLDELRAPFWEDQHGEAPTNAAGHDVPEANARPSDPNAGQGSQLGEG